MPSYPAEGGKKLAAAGSLKSADGKAIEKKMPGYIENQALVLVNYGNATGREIHLLAQNIMEDVYARFGIQLEPEVNLI